MAVVCEFVELNLSRDQLQKERMNACVPNSNFDVIVYESHSSSLILIKVALIVAALMIVKVFFVRQFFFWSHRLLDLTRERRATPVYICITTTAFNSYGISYASEA